MCPACYAALAWTIAGYAAAGGVTSVAVVKVAKAKKRKRRLNHQEGKPR
jgi:predicted transporter